MADPRSHTKIHILPSQLQPNHLRKSYAHIFCKSLIFLLFLVAIPLFSSQASNFIHQTILNKSWELVHLLFIGLAVSYGLFSYRNVEVDFEPHFNNFDDSQSSFVSRIFHVSPVFEDGHEIPCGSDDNYLYHTWNSQLYTAESMVNVSDGSSIIDERCKTRSLNYENGSEVTLDRDDHSIVQAWSSQCFQGESMVVESQPDCALDAWERPEQVVGYKPLGLPVRSLNSRLRNQDSAQFSKESESVSSLIGSSSSSRSMNMNDNNFGDMGPRNFDEKFDESFSVPSQMPWLSRSGRADMLEKALPVADCPSLFRPLSVDETQFESLKSQSFRSIGTASLSSESVSMSNSPTRLSLSPSSDSSNSITEESDKEKDFRASYPPASYKARLNAFHLRRYTSGSLFQKDLRGSLKDELKDLSGKKREDSLGNKERGQSSLKSDNKTVLAVRPSPKGKSIRTIRNGVYTADAMKAGETGKSHIDDQAGRGSNVETAVNIVNNELKKGGLHNISSGMNKKNLDARYDMPKPAYAKHKRREKAEYLENIAMVSEQDLENGTDKFRLSSDEDIGNESVSDTGHDSNEVDKKAGEFIAKFREQIRLQKVASIEKAKATRLSGKHLR